MPHVVFAAAPHASQDQIDPALSEAAGQEAIDRFVNNGASWVLIPGITHGALENAQMFREALAVANLVFPCTLRLPIDHALSILGVAMTLDRDL